MTKEEIGMVLKGIRMAAGLTQREAAEKLGRKQQTLASWEIGQAQPDANTLFTLCAIYGTSVDKAFGFESKKNTPAPDKPETGGHGISAVDAKCNALFYEFLVKAGFVENGQELTEAQQRASAVAIDMINIVFSGSSDTDAALESEIV